MKKFKLRYAIGLLCMVLVAYLVTAPNVKLKREALPFDLTKTEEKAYLNQEQYAVEMKKVVEPYLEQYHREGYYQPEEGVSLRYKQYQLDDAKGTIVISHGFCESIVKYEEVIYYFLKEGYSVYALEHRGHGYSTRATDDLSLATIEDFDSYVNDFGSFVETVVKPAIGEQKCFLYAHSMGGGIGARVLQEYPDLFDKAVLSAPMMQIQTGSVPERVANLIAKVMVVLGQGERYVAGQSAFEGVADYANSASGCEVRYHYEFERKIADEKNQVNASSYCWLNQSMKGIKELLKKKNLEKIKTPVLLFQAEKDSLVKPGGQNAFVNHVETAQLVFVKDAKHELYSADNSILIPYFNTIFDYYAA